jgi:hypothetical protein
LLTAIILGLEKACLRQDEGHPTFHTNGSQNRRLLQAIEIKHGDGPWMEGKFAM